MSQATIARDRAGSGFFRLTRETSREPRDGGGVRFFPNAISMTIPSQFERNLGTAAGKVLHLTGGRQGMR